MNTDARRKQGYEDLARQLIERGADPDDAYEFVDLLGFTTGRHFPLGQNRSEILRVLKVIRPALAILEKTSRRVLVQISKTAPGKRRGGKSPKSRKKSPPKRKR
jgi:hypothetical protein